MDREIRARLSERTVERLRKWGESKYMTNRMGYQGSSLSIDDVIAALLSEVGF